MMDRLSWFVVKHRKQIIFFYIILVALCLYGVFKIHVNYDIFSYLPNSLNSVKGYRILMDKFALGSTVQVLLPTTDLKKVDEFIEKAEKIEGVKKVDFVTTFIDKTQPIEFADKRVVENYIKKGSSLIRISFDESPSSPKTEQAFKKLFKICKNCGALIAGTVATNTDMKSEIQSSLIKFGLSAVVLVAIVLLLSLPSFIIPITFLFTIGTSAIINIGLSYYLGQELSYFTRVIAVPLQFAVTMDYALFLYHRFEELKREFDDETAMAKAISLTFKAVSSASFTTIAGFLALTLMQLGYGKNMGMVLARGVLISLIAIVTVLPSVVLQVRKLIEKLSHRIFIPDFSRLGEFSARHALTITIIGIVIFLSSYYMYQKVELDFNFKEGIPKNAPSQKALDVISKKFGTKSSVYLIYESSNSKKISRKLEEIKKLDDVDTVFSYAELADPLIPDFFIPDEVKEQFFKDGLTYAVINLKVETTDPKIPEILKEIRKIVSDSGNVYLSGESPMLEDMKSIVKKDIPKINLYSTLAILLIIMVAFRSISIPLILIATIETAILLNQGLYYLFDQKLIFIGALAIGAIQLGSTVDYAILLTTRFEEELRNGRKRRDAIILAVKESTISIATSAGTMFGATIGMYLFGTIGTIRELGFLISRGAVISFLAVTLLLPAYLYVFQPLIEKTSFRWPKEVK
jgi:hypothetical protein